MIISFLLDGISSIFLYKYIPLFTLTYITYISNYKNKDDFIKQSILIGILYDVVYTNTVILNSLIFLLLSLFLININKSFKNNIYNLIIKNIIVISLYLISTYLLLIIYQYINFDLIYLITTILKSYLLNTIYLLLIIFLFKKHTINW